MRAAVREAFVRFSSDLEGVVPWMYQDVKGLVTVAIGNLVDPMSLALDLPFVKPDGSPASRAEIASAWQAVKNRTDLARLGHRVAARATNIRLTPEGIERVVMAKFDQMARQLETRFPTLDEWPADAQLATMSMAWACGPAFRFPRLAACLRAKDFSGAAHECTIQEVGNPGVRPRNVRNRILYRNAAAVMRREPELDRDTLYGWETCLEDLIDTQPKLPEE